MEAPPSNPSQQSMSSMYFDGGSGLHSFKNKRRGSTGTYTSHQNAQSSVYTNESYTECTDELNFFNRTKLFKTRDQSIIEENEAHPNSQVIAYIETSSLPRLRPPSSSNHRTSGASIPQDSSSIQLFEYSNNQGGIQPRVRKQQQLKRSISLKSGQFLRLSRSIEDERSSVHKTYEVGDEVQLLKKMKEDLDYQMSENQKLKGVIQQLEKEKLELQSRLEQRIVTFTVKEAKWNKEKEAILDRLDQYDKENQGLRYQLLEEKELKGEAHWRFNAQEINLTEERKPPASAGGAFNVMSGRRSSQKPSTSNPHQRRSSVHDGTEQIFVPIREAENNGRQKSTFIKRNSIKSPTRMLSPTGNPGGINVGGSFGPLKRNSVVSPQRSQQPYFSTERQQPGRSSISFAPDQQIYMTPGVQNRPLIRKYSRAIKRLQMQKKIQSVSRQKTSGGATVLTGGIVLPGQSPPPPQSASMIQNPVNQSVIEELGTRELNNSTLGGTGIKQNFTRTAGFTQSALTSPKDQQRNVAHSSLINLNSTNGQETEYNSQINSPGSVRNSQGQIYSKEGVSREWIQRASNVMLNDVPPINRRPTPSREQAKKYHVIRQSKLQPPPLQSVPKPGPQRPIFTRSKMYQAAPQE